MRHETKRYTEIDGVLIMVEGCMDCPYWEPSRIGSWEGAYDCCRYPTRSKVIIDYNSDDRVKLRMADEIHNTPNFTCPLREMKE